MEAAEAAPARMAIRYVRNSNTAHPTGDPSFAVQQCIPGVVPEAEADPFLMCDEFGPTPSKGAYPDDRDELVRAVFKADAEPFISGDRGLPRQGGRRQFDLAELDM